MNKFTLYVVLAVIGGSVGGFTGAYYGADRDRKFLKDEANTKMQNDDYEDHIKPYVGNKKPDLNAVFESAIKDEQSNPDEGSITVNGLPFDPDILDELDESVDELDESVDELDELDESVDEPKPPFVQRKHFRDDD